MDVSISGPITAEEGSRGKSTSRGRLIWLDVGRTLALVAMAVFHFARALEMFAILPAGSTLQGSWPWFARTIAGSFLFLSGISFVIAHRDGFQPYAWAKRVLVIATAAVLITVVTYFMFPQSFIYFGILHVIAASSLVAAGLLRAPAWALAISVGLVLLVYQLVGATLFTTPWLSWTGLSSAIRPSLDFLPMIPWLALFVLGMAVAKAAPVTAFDVQLREGAVAQALTWPGRHSLFVYLIHQPILIAAIWLSTKVL